MATIKQVEALLDYLEDHPEMMVFDLAKTKEGRSLSKIRWAECAKILNCVGQNCPIKRADEWRTYYNEFKYKTLKKIKVLKSEQSATGGGIAKKLILTQTQERLFNLLEGNAGFRKTRSGYQSISRSDKTPPDGSLPTPPSPLPPGHTEVLLLKTAPESPTPSGSRENSEQRYRRQSPQRMQAHDADNMSLEASQERLERMEQRHAEAILAQTRATDRLAAALELVANRLSEPFVIKIKKDSPPPRKKRRHGYRKCNDSQDEVIFL